MYSAKMPCRMVTTAFTVGEERPESRKAQRYEEPEISKSGRSL